MWEIGKTGSDELCSTESFQLIVRLFVRSISKNKKRASNGWEKSHIWVCLKYLYEGGVSDESDQFSAKCENKKHLVLIFVRTLPSFDLISHILWGRRLLTASWRAQSQRYLLGFLMCLRTFAPWNWTRHSSREKLGAVPLKLFDACLLRSNFKIWRGLSVV